MTENEMNNQAAQTMPETGSWIAADDVYRHARTIDVALNGEAGAASRPALCDVVSQIATLARQHGPLAAALSQTAGVADGWRVSKPDSCRAGDSWEVYAPDGSGGVVSSYDIKDWAVRELLDALAAAPAASGGEARRVWQCPACPSSVEYAGKVAPPCPRCDTTTELDLIAKPSPPSASSVSERARELRERAEAHGGGVFVSIGDIRAIEQALTQQRGDDVESAARALFEAQADPLAASWDRQWEPTKAYWRLVARGYHVNADGVLTQPAYVSVHCGLADFTDYFVKNYPGPDTIIHDPKWHAPRIFGAARRAIMASPEYAAATTPQPSADAVRELVERWRSNGHPYVSDCADELESLLSGGSNA